MNDGMRRSPETTTVAAAASMITSGASGRLSAFLSVRAFRRLLVILRSAALFLAIFFLPSRGASVEGSAGSSRKRGKGGVALRIPAAMVPPRRKRDPEVAARRAVAVQRVLEERGCGWRREFAMLRSARGDKLFTQSWAPPASVRTRCLIVLLHGLNEHSVRYDHFAKKLSDNGFKVYAMDWIGHGGSDGLHGYVQSLDHVVDDLKAFLEKVWAENPGTPCFCFGHSTGAAIILKAICDPKIENRIEGVVLTSPAVSVQPSHPIIKVLAPIFCLVAPKYQFGAATNSASLVSRDVEALRSKYSDPLVFTGSIRVMTGYEILRLSTYLQQNLERVSMPFLVLHGTADTVTNPIGSQRLFNEAVSADKSIRLYEGLLHDLLIEPEGKQIMEDIVSWFSSRI